MRLPRLVPLALCGLIASCIPAASTDYDSAGERGDEIDAASGPDAADAGGKVAVTLRQTTSDAIRPKTSIGCFRPDGDTIVEHLDTSYYRMFDLAAAGVDRDLEIASVRLGIEKAVSATGTQAATVSLHTLDGPLATANLAPLASVDLEIGDQSGTHYTAPIVATAPAGSRLVVEVHVASGVGARRLFILGANLDGQTGPSYLRAPTGGCGMVQPTDLAALGFPNVAYVLEVSGSY